MRSLASLSIAAAAAALLAAPAAGQTLARTAPLRVYPALEQGAGAGVLVDRVEAGGTAARLGILPGDRILSLGAVPTTSAQTLGVESRKLRDGATAQVVVQRAGRSLNLSGPAVARERESWPGARTDYGAVPFAGGLLRDVYVEAPGRGPVVYLIPGYNCLSVESLGADHPYTRLIGGLLAKGIGVYRIEKPGVGDSLGTPQCETSDFDVEVAAFEAGYRALTETRGVDPDRIFIFGHSMGGVEAPLVAARAKAPPRGIAVYGTVMRNWHDYFMDIASWQSFLMAGADPVEGARSGEAIRSTATEVHLGSRTLAELARDPRHAAALREMGWDGGEGIAGRHVDYWRDIARLDLAAAWRDARSRVLSLHGESDLVAISAEDHRLIADIVNHYRPGSAAFEQLAETNHLLERVGGPKAAREAIRAAAGGPPPSGPYNERFDALLSAWIEAVLKAPPVRDRA